MPEFASAIELLKPVDTALVVFTKGQYLTDNHDGTGSTGWWKIDPQHRLDYVIVYRRASGDQDDNDLFIARHDGVEGPREDGRYLVRLLDLTMVGYTTANWRAFADTYAKEFRYISRPVG